MLCLSGFELYSRWVPLIIEFTNEMVLSFRLRNSSPLLITLSTPIDRTRNLRVNSLWHTQGSLK